VPPIEASARGRVATSRAWTGRHAPHAGFVDTGGESWQYATTHAVGTFNLKKVKMRKILLPASLALIQMVATAAFAQSSGEADPAQAKAPPVAKQTTASRAAGHAERKATGQEAAHGPQMGEGQSEPTATPKVSSADRKAANAKRRATVAEANKAGELSRGGNPDAPEKQKP
jgi:hypothetical protein